jgi:DNA modification methylase
MDDEPSTRLSTPNPRHPARCRKTRSNGSPSGNIETPARTRKHRGLKITWLPLGSLTLDPRNPRAHPRKQIRQIARSIEEFGFIVPILVDQNLKVVAGHGRVFAAIMLGLTEVPVIRLEHMTVAQAKAFMIADNRLTENSHWDDRLLAENIQELLISDLEFDLTITGFETAEIDLRVQRLESVGPANDDDDVPAVDESAKPVTRIGDKWNLGPHRIICADASEPKAFELLIGPDKAQMVFVDPPYNLKIEGHVNGRGSIRHREFVMASGEMSEDEYTAFLTTAFRNLVMYSCNGSIHFICIDWRHLWEALSALRASYATLKNVCIWSKDNGGQGSLYRSKHEMILVAKNGTAPHINNVELGRFGRNRTNVWNYPGVNTFRKGRLDDLAMHPTVKPVTMVADAILDCSQRGAIVLDCFGGSGTTLIAAEKTGRRGFLMELDPKYVDVTIRRFQKLTGKEAVHAYTGLTFEEVQLRRARKDPRQTLATDGEEK